MKKLLPLAWLFLIPCTIIPGFLFVRLGVFIDQAIFSNPEANGHGIPIFSLIFWMIAAVSTVIVSIAAIGLMISGFIKRRK